MADKPVLKVRIIDPNQVLFDGTADFVFAPTSKGMLGILPSHTPLFAELTPGTLELHGQQSTEFLIEAGIIRVHNDGVTILIGL